MNLIKKMFKEYNAVLIGFKESRGDCSEFSSSGYGVYRNVINQAELKYCTRRFSKEFQGSNVVELNNILKKIKKNYKGLIKSSKEMAIGSSNKRLWVNFLDGYGYILRFYPVYPLFTAEKQLELIKILLEYNPFIASRIKKQPNNKWKFLSKDLTFEEVLAEIASQHASVLNKEKVRKILLGDNYDR